MTRSQKLVLYAGFAATLFLLALVLGRPELVALGAPFAVVLVMGLSLSPPGRVRTKFVIDNERLIEGEETGAAVVIETDSRVPLLSVALHLPSGISLSKSEQRYVLGLRAGEERRLPLRLQADHWGAFRLGDLRWRAMDGAGIRVEDHRVRGGALIRVYPRPEKLRSLMAPLETQPFAGNRVARSRSEGIEFADVRPYAPGDRPRRINWRATSLRQTLHVNQQHPERNSDVVILLDSFAEARTGNRSTLDLAVRAAASLAGHYLARRDRVGLVSFGGVVRWLTPSTGTRQVYRIVEALIETEVIFSFVWKGIDALPPRSLTPQSLVIALSPLLDDRGVHALIDLRRRGFDLVVVELPPLAFSGPGTTTADVLATRFWNLWRDAIRFRFEELGVALMQWDGMTPLATTVEEVRAFRRFARYASR